MTLLIIATRNAHKVREIQAVLSSNELGFRTLNDFPNPPAILEDADTFAGNAAKKAVELASWLAATPRLLPQALTDTKAARVFCLADDSGLEVDALHGAPGVRSARFAALDPCGQGNSSDQANNAKLLRLLAGLAPEARTARFRCVIALSPVYLGQGPGSATERGAKLFEGACDGRISDAPRGQHGFGYDPLFVPNSFTESFAELGDDVKNQISHRAKALSKLREFLSPERDPR
jgi:XTP/dITP diphosphohydrolase